MDHHQFQYALVFPGQGSQYLKMCEHAYQRDPAIAALFETASDVFSLPLASLIFDGTLADLTQTNHAQPAVFLASYVMYYLFSLRVPHPPAYFAGHSLGEITAFVAAGALSFEAGCQFIQARARMMQAAQEQRLGEAALVADITPTLLQSLIETVSTPECLGISAYNANNQHVVAGTLSAIKALGRAVHGRGGELIPFRMIPMKANAPYHSAFMAPFLPAFEDIVAGLPIQEPSIPVVSSVTGLSVCARAQVKAALARQLVCPVLWSAVIKALQERTACIIEAGPAQTLRNLAREDPAIDAVSFFAYDDASDQAMLNQLFTRVAA